MEHVIALRVIDAIHGERGFMTWGRLYDAVDNTEIVNVVRRQMPRFWLYAVTSVHVYYDLSDASHYEFFYEGWLEFAREPIPFGKRYEQWVARKRAGLEIEACDLFRLGRPYVSSTTPASHDSHAVPSA